MTDGADILSLIDAAVEDWETGPDAVRYNGPEPAEVEDSRSGWPYSITMIRAAAEFEQQMLAFTGSERDEFVAYWQSSPWSFEQAWFNWVGRRAMEAAQVTLTAWSEQFTMICAGLRESMSQLARSFSRKPCGALECFCHPDPFPAARDYRRRTRHRNRRRR